MAPAPKNVKRERKADTRAPEAVFASKVNSRLNIMNRQFSELQKLGRARKAVPTPEQVAKVEDWLKHQTDLTVEAFRAKLHSVETGEKHKMEIL